MKSMGLCATELNRQNWAFEGRSMNAVLGLKELTFSIAGVCFGARIVCICINHVTLHVTNRTVELCDMLTGDSTIRTTGKSASPLVCGIHYYVQCSVHPTCN